MSKPFIFTLMPFDKSFDDVYKLGIKTICEEEGAYCERVDEQIFQGSILDRIINQISKADIIIADMTGRSPNVFFEVGYAKALDKKVILLTSVSEDIPFDLKHYTHIVYEGSILNLKRDLQPHLTHYLSNLNSSTSEMLFGVNVYIFDNMLDENGVNEIKMHDSRYIPLSIENISGKTFESQSIQISASVLGSAYNGFFKGHNDIKYLTDKNHDKHMAIYNEGPIFPGATDTFQLCEVGRDYKTESIEVFIYTNNGFRSFTIQFSFL